MVTYAMLKAQQRGSASPWGRQVSVSLHTPARPADSVWCAQYRHAFDAPRYPAPSVSP
jgi:hypothetical protein